MKKFLAVDGNSIVNRAFYGVRPLSNKEGFPTNALFGMVGILEKNMEAVKPDYSVKLREDSVEVVHYVVTAIPDMAGVEADAYKGLRV